jgi:hypothetical protein
VVAAFGVIGQSSCGSPLAAGTAVRDCAGVDHARAIEFARDVAALTQSLGFDPIVSCTSEGGLFLEATYSLPRAPEPSVDFDGISIPSADPGKRACQISDHGWQIFFAESTVGSVTVQMVGQTSPIASCPAS